MSSDSIEEENCDDNMEGECKADDGEEDADDEDGDDHDEDEGGESVSEEDTNESESDSDDDDEESEGEDAVQKGEDGRTLSAYEVMRLERIKRNKEYLKKLGLDNNNSSSSATKEAKPTTLLSPFTEQMMKAKREKKKKRQLSSSSTATEKIERRTPSRRTRKQINYSELPHPSSAKSNDNETEKESKKKKRKERPPKSRMPRVIFNEFKRIEKERRKSLQESKRLLKASETEYKFSNRLAQSFLKKQHKEQLKLQRQQMLEKQRNERKREHDILRPLWFQAEMKQYETRMMLQKYDAWKDDCLRQHLQACHDLEAQMMDTSNSFKACLDNAIKTLDNELLKQLGCSLVDKRRKKRKAPSNKTNPKKKQKKQNRKKEETELSSVPSSSNVDDTTAVAAVLSVPNPLADTDEKASSTVNEQQYSSPSPPTQQQQQGNTITAEEELLLHTKSLDDTTTQMAEMTYPTLDPSTSPPQASKHSEADKCTSETAPTSSTTTEKPVEPEKPSEPKKPKKLHARQVGGPITPEFSSQIKRSWLSSKDTPSLINAQTFTEEGYIPQVNDIVLYYPSAHFEFLETYPDIRAKKSRLKLRLPLWERATSNSGTSRKQSDKEQPSNEQQQEDEMNGSPAQNQEEQLQNDKRQTKKKKETQWYTQEWIDQIKSSKQGGLGSYPILCRVEQTHAEFPFDHNASSLRKVKPKASKDQKTKQHDKDDHDEPKTTPTIRKQKKKAKGKNDNQDEIDANTSSLQENKQKKKSKKSKQDDNDGKDKDQSKTSSKKSTRTKTKTRQQKEKKDQKRKTATKAPKKVQQKKNSKPTQLQLELSVTLKPLTPILPPPSFSSKEKQDEVDDKDDEIITTPPPLFTVITFPTTKVPPFLVPFAWAYQFTQSLQIGNRVKFKFEKEGQQWHEGTIYSFVPSSSLTDSSSIVTTPSSDAASEDKNVVILDRQQQQSKNPSRLEYNMDVITSILSSAFNGNIPKSGQLHHVVSALLYLTSTSASMVSSSTGRSAGGDASNLFRMISKEELYPIVENIVNHYYYHKEQQMQQQSPPILNSGKNTAPLGEKKSIINSVLFRLIRRTLPLWDGVTVLWDDKSVCNISPWELIYVPSSSSSAFHSDSSSSSHVLPQQDALSINTLHEPLREKIENALKDYTKTKAQAAIFTPPVTNSIAPSYFCFVPIGMCFRKILKRLKTHSLLISTSCFNGEDMKENVSSTKASKRSASKRSTSSTYTSRACYYRSVGSLLSDVMDVFHCCIAYNDPSSELVLQAKMVVEEVKSLILDLDHEYTKETASREKEEGRRQMVMLGGALGIGGGTASKSEPKSARRRKGGRCKVKAPPPLGTGFPFPVKLCSEWAQSVHPDGFWDANIPSSNEPTMSVVAGAAKVKITPSRDNDKRVWVPQSGDKILYSPTLHRQFIAGHLADLREEQISLPPVIPNASLATDYESKEGQNAEGSSQWLVGTIVSVRAVFPSNSQTSTFEQISPIMALGIKLYYDWAFGQPHFIYWRHCVLHTPNSIEFKQDIALTCGCCGLLLSSSFLRPAWVDLPLPDQGIHAPSSPSDVSYQTQPNGIPESSRAPISECLDILKKRCIDDVPPGSSDLVCAHRTTNDIDINLQMLCLENETDNGITILHNNVAAIQQAKMRLSKVHFLPPWLSSASPREMVVTTQAKISPTRKRPGKDTSCLNILPALSPHENVLPLPFLCLELVRGRLKSCYYRQFNALINDVQEAYISSALFVCAEGHDNEGEKPKEELTKFMKRIIPLLRKDGADGAPSAGEQLLNSFTSVAAAAETGGVASNSEEPSQDLPLDPTNKEILILSKIKSIRELYATALVSVLQPFLAKKVLSNPYTEQKRDFAQKRIKHILEEQKRDSARENICLLLDALGRDFCTIRRPLLVNEFGPTVRVKIVLEDEYSNIEDEVKCIKTIDNIMTSRNSKGPGYKGPAEDGKDGDSVCRNKSNASLTDMPEDPAISTIEGSESNGDARNTDERLQNEEEINAREYESSAVEKVTGDPVAHLHPLAETDYLETCKNDEDITGKISDAQVVGISTEGKVTGAAVAQSSNDLVMDLSEPINLYPRDYLHDEELTKALFGVDGRRDLCIRCKMSRKNFFFCRIVKAHSNADFDWTTCLEKPGGINGLLHQMLPSAYPHYPNTSSGGICTPAKSISTSIASNENDVAAISQSAFGVFKGSVIKADNESPPSNATGNSNNDYEDTKSPPVATSVNSSNRSSLQVGPTEMPSATTQKDMSDPAINRATSINPPKPAIPIAVANSEPSVNDSSTANCNAATNEESTQQKSEQAGAKTASSDPCPLRVLAIAERALQMAKDAHALAEKETDSRPVLCEDFIQRNFPIDAIDGHYEYCIVCGLSGNIMCCEGCPNVAHPCCVGLNQVPDDDWFCKKCLASTQKVSRGTFNGVEQSGKCCYGDHTSGEFVHEVKHTEYKLDKMPSEKITDLTKLNATETWERKLINLERCNKLEELVEGLRSIRLRGGKSGRGKEKGVSKAKVIEKEGIVIDQDTRTENNPPYESADSEKPESHQGDKSAILVVDGEGAFSNEEAANHDTQPHGIKEENEGDDISLQDDELETTEVTKFSLGTKITKIFQEYGEFNGIVTRIPTNEEPFYRVRYEDGDEEDMSEDEIEKCVKPTTGLMTNKNPKRKRGRPRKAQICTTGSPKPKPTPRRKRGRPKK